MTANTRFTLQVLALCAIAQTPACGQRAADGLPPVPVVHGPLDLRVRYPAAGARIAAGDSTFLFGTVGNGRAALTIDGQAVEVAPNGAWLAWIRIPADSAFDLHLEATLDEARRSVVLPLRREGRLAANPDPTGVVWLPRGEPLTLTVRQPAGATVQLQAPDIGNVSFSADSSWAPIPAGIRAFDRDSTNLRRQRTGDRYVGTARGGVLADASTMLDSVAPAQNPRPSVLVTTGTARGQMPWPLQINRISTSLAVVLDDDVGRTGATDRTVIGRTTPGGTYAWFFPNGTVAHADARIGNDVRLRLANDAVAWVPLQEVRVRPASDDMRLARMGALSLSRDSGFVRLRIPLSFPVPAQVDQQAERLIVTLFGAVADADWTRYGASGSMVRLLTWRQAASDRVELTIDLTRPLWGWRVRVDGTDLVIDVREPPRINVSSPLRGRHIVIDAGHPPVGACGPSNVCEPEVNLAIARRVRDRLVALGARVTMTRDDERPVGLAARVAIADSVNAEVLVSIHNNALPDGVNPFTNNGSSTFFNHPHGLPLARAVQQRLVANLGLRDLGIARGDLALVRPTWYPAILTEGMFLMIPRQEAALASRQGQSRYAAAIVEGLTTWLRDLSQPARVRTGSDR